MAGDDRASTSPRPPSGCGQVILIHSLSCAFSTVRTVALAMVDLKEAFDFVTAICLRLPGLPLLVTGLRPDNRHR